MLFKTQEKILHKTHRVDTPESITKSEYPEYKYRKDLGIKVHFIMDTEKI